MPNEDVPYMESRELLAEETADDACEEERALHLEEVPGEFEDHEQFDEGTVDEEQRNDADSDLEDFELEELFVCEGCHETMEIDQLADRDRLMCRACDHRRRLGSRSAV
jgi:hypothetical protein